MKIDSLVDRNESGTATESQGSVIHRKSRYTLAQLLAQHEGDIPRLPEWESMPSVGLEAEGF